MPARCRVCRGHTESFRAAGSAFDRCRSCGYSFLRQHARARDYWPAEEAAESAFWTESKRAYFRSTLTLLAERTEGRRLLDVGGGVGFFAELALQRGWDAYSVDVSPVATAAARGRIGAARALGSLDGIPPASVDVATLWCVIAHVDDPGDLIRAVWRTVRPGGLVWLTTPNFLFHRWYGALRRAMGRPIDFAGDDHRGQFTPRAVSFLLREHGFDAPTWHYRGITALCAATMREGGPSLALKRGWNRGAHVAAGLGLPNLMSELQAVARRRDDGAGAARAPGRI